MDHSILLQDMLTWVEINSAALSHNIKTFKRIAGEGKLIAVVKSNAYGHGIFSVSKLCDANPGIEMFGVASLDEALELRAKGIKKSILVMSFGEWNIEKATAAVRGGLHVAVYDMGTARCLQRVGEDLRTKAKIHLKFDIGTTRVGIQKSEWPQWTELLRKSPYLEIEGVMGHFAASEEDKKFTEKQFKYFTTLAMDVVNAGWNPKMRHVACTAAALAFPKTRMDAIRIGIGLYGLYPEPSLARGGVKLAPALSWHTKLISVLRVGARTPVGYGHTFYTKRPAKIGVLPVGYFDGFDRGFSNCGEALVRGARCPVIGRVCMNLTMIDCTKVKDVAVGDTATLIGAQGAREIKADDMARKLKTINYEVVTRINSNIPRILI